MAGMVIFGRRWSVATDDFTFIGIIDFILFFFWLCWTSVIYDKYARNTCLCYSQCFLLSMFLVGALVLFAMNTIVAILFIYYGSRGAIPQTEKRKPVVPVVYVKLAVSVIDVIWAVIGSVACSYRYGCVVFDAELNVKIITGVLWVVSILRILCVWAVYNSKGKEKKPGLAKFIHNENFHQPVAAKSAKKWKRRLWAVFFGFLSKDRKLAVGAAAELLAFLTDDMDIVLSDFVCGLKFYKNYSQRIYETEKENLESTPNIQQEDGTEIDAFPTVDMPNWMNLKLASHYFNVGMGIFGWPWVIYRNLTCGLCHLFRKMVCCLPCRSRFAMVKGDNCCGCNLAGLRHTSGYRYEDLVHVRFVDEVYQIPFFVAVDEETNSVMLVVRGSMSIADALTDISAQFIPLDEPGLPKEGICHGGALIAARRIRERLEQNKALETAFSGGRENYSLVITGHSIGAGVSSLLTLLLKNTYSNIRCFAFAPPPVMNKVLLPLTMDNVFTMVFGNDTVVYLNYRNVRNMLVDLYTLLNDCKDPKYKALCCCFDSSKGSILRSREADSPASTVDIDSTATATVSDEVDVTVNGLLPESTFFVPGRILHIRKASTGYRLKVCHADEYSRLLFRPDMVKHHFPQYIQGALQHLGQNESIAKDDSILHI